MKKVCNSIVDLIGNTPILELKNIEKEFNLKGKLFAKLEYTNPAGSIKDRVAYSMIIDAMNKGLINKDTTIIEPTSGNTGIGICAICADMGYKVIIVMPDTMSKERILSMKAYGAEVVLTDGSKGMQGSIDKANELNKTIKNSIIAGQFENQANPKIHYETTAREIFETMEGDIDIFISTIGTGGTISGVGKYLKERLPDVKIVGVEPSNSPLLSQNKVGKHKIQGIGANFIPKVLDKNIYDEIITVTDDEAYNNGSLLARKQGLMCGISSGACLTAGILLATKEENKNKNIVMIFADTGMRYLSTENYYKN